MSIRRFSLHSYSNSRQSAINAYNNTPRASLGGRSPHELVYGRGASIRVPESLSVVPERFHQGRKSLSVTRNVTVRESKRPKARVHDQDYRRRSSMSPSVRQPLIPEVGTHLQAEGGDGWRNEGTPSRNANYVPGTPVARMVQKWRKPTNPISQGRLIGILSGT